MPEVCVRVGRAREAESEEYYLDLADGTGRAVRITTAGWLMVDRPPVHFWHPPGLLPMPVPEASGSVELLRKYVNLTDADFQLLICWMAAALLPEGPYPILTIHAEQGSGKTMLAKIARKLVDPQASAVLAAPQSTRDLMVTACNGWLLVYDNVSVIPNWLSDGFCRLATGGGFASRALFTDQERHDLDAQRPVILNGIDEFVRRDDLADRCVFVHLPPIGAGSRRAEREFWRSFKADYPAILGGLLNAVVGGLRELPSVRIAELPRMADFACFGEAVGRGLGWPAETFLAAYGENRKVAAFSTLEESLVAKVLNTREILDALLDEGWSASRLLDFLTRSASPRVASSTRWPKSPQALSNELRRIAPQFRTRGVNIRFTRTNGCRRIIITRDKDSLGAVRADEADQD